MKYNDDIAAVDYKLVDLWTVAVVAVDVSAGAVKAGAHM